MLKHDSELGLCAYGTANGNSEPRAEKMLRMSESMCTLRVDARNTEDLEQSDKN